MDEPKVWTFFYGSFINLDVLEKVDLIPDELEVATLSGFDIRIAPLANLIRSDEHTVYGILATATHAELRRLYDHAETDLGGTYLPEAVLARTTTGQWRPALCYVAPMMQPRPAAAGYVDRIVMPARRYDFPEWYIERLDSYRPSPT